MAELSVPEMAACSASIRPARSDINSHARFWLPAGLLVAVDLFSKSWVFSWLKPDDVMTAVPGWLEVRRSLNDGAVFGSFSGYVSVFVAASIFALLFVIYLFLSSPRDHRVLHVCLGMILAGACGNLFDRIVIQADVVRVRHDGQMRTVMIGVEVGEREAESLRMGPWPEGALGPVRTFERAAVELSRQGVVRDFLSFVPKFPAWVPRVGGREVWPWVFNVADASLVCGVILLVGTTLFERRHP